MDQKCRESSSWASRKGIICRLFMKHHIGSTVLEDGLIPLCFQWELEVTFTSWYEHNQHHHTDITASSYNQWSKSGPMPALSGIRTDGRHGDAMCVNCVFFSFHHLLHLNGRYTHKTLAFLVVGWNAASFMELPWTLSEAQGTFLNRPYALHMRVTST